MKKISARGKTFTGTVISDKMAKTVTVEWPRKNYIPKYERYEYKRTRVKAHLPENIEASIGDKVRIRETRPLSKTKHFIVIENLTRKKQEQEKNTEKKQNKKTTKKENKKQETKTKKTNEEVKE